MKKKKVPQDVPCQLLMSSVGFRGSVVSFGGLGKDFGFRIEGSGVMLWGFRLRVADLRTTTLQKCAAVPRRDRIQGS